MKRLNGLWSLVAAAVLVTAVACGGGSNKNGATCSQDSDCAKGELCHPLAKFCVTACTSSSGCPSNEKTCGTLPLPDGGTSASFCQCTQSSDCVSSADGGATALCGAEDHVCEEPCTQSSDCNGGRTCDTTSGQCVTGGSTGGGACTSSNETIGTQGGQDVCAYGQYCPASSNACTPASVCTDSTVTTGAPSWSTSNNQAPVITSVSAQSQATSNGTTQCQGGGPAVVVTINYYSATGFTQTPTYTHLQNQIRFNDGSGFHGAAFPVTEPGAGAHFGSMQFGWCISSQHVSAAAVYITDDAGNSSNTVCFSY